MREKRDCIVVYTFRKTKYFLDTWYLLESKKKKLYSDQQAHVLTLKNKRGKWYGEENKNI